MERNGIDRRGVDDVIFGCTNQAGRGQPQRGPHGLAAGRPAGRGARRDGEPPLRLGARGGQPGRARDPAGEGDLLLAGGVESMSRAPFVTLKPERGFPARRLELVDTTIGWRFVNPRMEELHSTESMGETAENVAERYGVSREDQDAFALESHRRAIAAQRGRALRRGDRDRRRAPAQGRAGHGARRRGPARRHHARAAGARSSPCSARAARSRPATRRRSTTAPPAWCSPARSGAERSAASRWRASCSTGAAGVDPAYMGIGPVPASRMALERAGLDDRRHRPRRAERGLRRPGAGLRPRARHPAREAQRERRRDRHRPPARLRPARG